MWYLMLPNKPQIPITSQKYIEIFQENTILNWHRFFFPRGKRTPWTMHTVLSKTNCSTICIEIIRSQLLEQGWMLIVLLLLRNNTVLIWSQHNLDLIEDNCDPHCSEDRILCTVYTGTCPPPVHPHHSDRRFRLATSSGTQHQMQANKEQRVVNRVFGIFRQSFSHHMADVANAA